MTDVLPAQTAETTLRTVVASATHVGGRSENEDAICVAEVPPVGVGEAATEGGHLLAVADGMGGYQRGEVAAKMAIDTLREMFAEDPGADPALLLKQAFRRANEKIYENGLGTGQDAMMGTTLVAVVTHGKYVTIASIGDSRAYLARANRLTQITKDHTIVAEQVARGSMTEQEARESPHRNVLTHALGHRPKVESKLPDIFEITLLPEDRLLLCSDGLYDVVPDDEMLRALTEGAPEDAAQRLVDLAVSRNASDNVSAIVLAALPTREKPAVLETAGTGRTSFLLPAIAAVILILILAAVFFFAL
ncbi:MAG TPA: PP2C family serine/threonine-protein phosphatase [Thermomicrobiales bacterium]